MTTRASVLSPTSLAASLALLAIPACGQPYDAMAAGSAAAGSAAAGVATSNSAYLDVTTCATYDACRDRLDPTQSFPGGFPEDDRAACRSPLVQVTSCHRKCFGDVSCVAAADARNSEIGGSLSCEDRASCQASAEGYWQVSASESASLVVRAPGGSNYQVTCATSGTCDVTCMPGSSCSLFCERPEGCSVTCEANASCYCSSMPGAGACSCTGDGCTPYSTSPSSRY